MREYCVYGLGNGIMDILVSAQDQELIDLKLNKGTMQLVSPEVQGRLLERFAARQPMLASGGSAANTVIALAQLGAKAAYACVLGDDQYGKFYSEEFSSLGIKLDLPLVKGGLTATCLILITPDAERTGNTCLGVSASLSPEHVNEQTLKSSEWLYIEGYLFAQPEGGQAAIEKAISIAKRHGVKVAITFSDTFIIDIFGEPLRKAVKQADLIFANKVEACAFSGLSDELSAFNALKAQVPNVVMTRGSAGALIKYGQMEDLKISAYNCKPVDLTGAGDMYAGAFLYGVSTGHSAEVSARSAAYLSMKVITQLGARLHNGVKESWQEAINTM